MPTESRASVLSVFITLDEKGAIATGQKTPERLEHFNCVTMGKWVVFGRHTWQSINKPLPGRCVIVVSKMEGCVTLYQDLRTIVTSGTMLNDLLCMGKKGVYRPEMVVAGGLSIFRAAIPLASTIYLMHFKGVNALSWNAENWQTTSSEEQGVNSPYSFSILKRIKQG